MLTLGDHNFNPDRLKTARIAQALTMPELAEKMNVSRQAISCWEKGQRIPSAMNIGNLSCALAKPRGFFFKEESRELIDSVVAFRKRQGTAKRDFSAALEKNKTIGELLNRFDERMRLREAKILEGIDPHQLDNIDIEAEALKLRELWGLGLRGISNITHLLENNGIMCLRQNYPLKIDAFSYTMQLNNGRQSLICVNEEKNFYRQRFNLCHELAHLVLHSECDQLEFEENEKKFERQANLFAAAFLMPTETFRQSVLGFSLDYLKEMKKEWGVSIAAMIHRLRSTGLINEDRYRYLYPELSKKGWRRVEPYDKETPLEKPYLMDAYLGIYFDNICSKEELLAELGIYEQEAYEITGSELFKESKLEPKMIPFSLADESC